MPGANTPAAPVPPYPHILVIATGGTIASVAGEHGLHPALLAQDLVAAVPEIQELAHIEVLQLMNQDSTNMQPTHWLHMARAIQGHFDEADGFVMLHGTDTMAYSAAALSYLIQHTAKPIVFTGSQQPMTAPFSDARLNLYQAVKWAVQPCAHDVSIVFGGHVIAGTRGHKQKTLSARAFTSVNFPTLAEFAHETLQVNPLFLPSTYDKTTRPLFFDELNPRVLVAKLTPGMTPELLEALHPLVDGLILEAFGIGGIPQLESWEQAIAAWLDTGHYLIMTTQVPEEGLDLGVYEVGAALAANPRIFKGGDMTTEALVAKTMWALAQEDPARAFMTPINFDRK